MQVSPRDLCLKSLRAKLKGRPGVGEVYIGRGHPRLGLAWSKWANPFKITADRSRGEAIGRVERFLVDSGLVAQIGELAGKVLLCHCRPGDRCHGDVLVEHAERWARNRACGGGTPA